MFEAGKYTLHPFQSVVAFHIQTSNLICTADERTGFCLKYNSGLKMGQFVLIEHQRHRFLIYKQCNHQIFRNNDYQKLPDSLYKSLGIFNC